MTSLAILYFWLQLRDRNCFLAVLFHLSEVWCLFYRHWTLWFISFTCKSVWWTRQVFLCFLNGVFFSKVLISKASSNLVKFPQISQTNCVWIISSTWTANYAYTFISRFVESRFAIVKSTFTQVSKSTHLGKRAFVIAPIQTIHTSVSTFVYARIYHSSYTLILTAFSIWLLLFFNNLLSSRNHFLKLY